MGSQSEHRPQTGGVLVMKPPVILSLPLLLIVFPPCHSDPSSCCRHLRLESFGEASQHQNNRLGEFFISGLYGERPLFKLKDQRVSVLSKKQGIRSMDGWTQGWKTKWG